LEGKKMKKKIWKRIVTIAGVLVGAVLGILVYIISTPRKEFDVKFEERKNPFKLHNLEEIPLHKQRTPVYPIVTPNSVKIHPVKKKDPITQAPVEPKEKAATPAAKAEKPAGTPKVPAALTNLNTADKQALVDLPLIGESKAEAIIAYRDEHGKFTSIAELSNVPGISEKMIAKLSDYLTL
jgi:comEA protein